MNKVAWVAASLMVAGPFLSVAEAAQRRANVKKAEVKVVASPEMVIGTVQYDTGTNAGFHPDGSGAEVNRIVGNRFNSALGGPLLATGMVTRLTVFPANGGAQYVSVGTAPAGGVITIQDFVQATLTANTFNQVAISSAVGADFVGMFMGTFGATQATGLLGMSDMANLGQGYHAIVANYVGSSQATGATPVPNRNAMLRAFGNILTPVELMDFQVQ